MVKQQREQSEPKEVTPEQLERRKQLNRDRQRRCYQRRVERREGKPFEECLRRKGPKPSDKMETYGQRRARAHRLAYELHKRECQKIDCSICSISFAVKPQEKTVLDAVLDAPSSLVAVRNI